MTDSGTIKGPGTTAADARQDRLKAALRANLKRRKARDRAVPAEARVEADEPGPPPAAADEPGTRDA